MPILSLGPQLPSQPQSITALWPVPTGTVWKRTCSRLIRHGQDSNPRPRDRESSILPVKTPSPHVHDSKVFKIGQHWPELWSKVEFLILWDSVSQSGASVIPLCCCRLAADAVVIAAAVSCFVTSTAVSRLASLLFWCSSSLASLLLLLLGSEFSKIALNKSIGGRSADSASDAGSC